MFGNLKKKLNSAIQEGLALTENLQQQYLNRYSAPDSPTTLSNTIDVNKIGSEKVLELSTAGCSLLAKYEKNWEEIHEQNNVNSQSADVVAKQIESIEKRMQQQRIVMTNLNNCLLGLPEISQKLKDSMQVLQQVQALTEVVEDKLERLQILCEECEVQEFILKKHCEVSQYKQKKLVELEAHRKKVALAHEQSIQKHEEQLRLIQSERQAVFDAAFRDDLDEYRQNGLLKKIEGAKMTNSVKLEEVTLEDISTKDALEEFLNC